MRKDISYFQVIDDKEDIGRIIFAPSMVCDDKVSPSAFYMVQLKNGNPEDYVSVWRLALKTPSRDNVKFPPRNPEDSLFGYASLKVRDCHTASFNNHKCSIMVNPNSPNQFHAGIYYSNGDMPIIGRCYEPSFLLLTSYLAEKSELIKI